MAQWGTTDADSNSVIWAPVYVKEAPTAANRDILYNQANADYYIAGVTIGTYGVDESEIALDGGKVAHTGWVLRTVGSGGRAGRVQTEVLVAGGMTADANTDFPEYGNTA
jgi:hypothetical protein